MLFSEMVVEEAQGALLAHSLRTAKGKISKGQELSADDVLALRNAGYSRIYAARLEEGDMQEDVAAHSLSKGIAGEHVLVGEAGTGRVYLYAMCDGLLEIDTPAIHRFNEVDQAIALATLLPLAPVRAGQVIATLKIIPFSVKNTLVEQMIAELTAKQNTIIKVRPFALTNVALIQTYLPDTPQKILDKTTATLTTRLERMGGSMALARELRCAHKIDELALAITYMRSRVGCELLVISSASATLDKDDVLPTAIRLAGATVERVGMPVDPGNLLVLGDSAGVPIIGMPGCARSPKTNGFDWVLQRLSAALPVSSRDIAMMGVGGLLTSFSSQPNAGDTTSSDYSRLKGALV